jgi:hypothetical protein
MVFRFDGELLRPFLGSQARMLERLASHAR